MLLPPPKKEVQNTKREKRMESVTCNKTGETHLATPPPQLKKNEKNTAESPC